MGECLVCVIFFAKLAPHDVCCANYNRGVTGGGAPQHKIRDGFWSILGSSGTFFGLFWALCTHGFLAHGFFIMVKELSL